jgi:hypothetical protein
MPANDRSTLNKALKFIYEPGLNFAIQNNIVFLNGFTKKKFPGVGKAYVFATHLKRNTNVGSRAHDGYYLPAGGETVDNGSVLPTYTHIPFEITNDLMKAAKGDRAAFKDGMRIVQETSRNTITKDLNRQALGDGTGVLCSLAADAGGAGTRTLTVNGDSGRPNTLFLEEGMWLDVWSKAGATRRNDGAANPTTETAQAKAIVVQSVTDDTTFTAAMYDATAMPAITANDVVTRWGNSVYNGTARASRESNGLRLFADDGTLDPTGGLHGISAATYNRWKGIVKDAGGIPISPAVASAVGILFKQKSSTKYDQMWMHDNQAHGLLYGADGSYKDKRFVNGSVTEIGDNTEAVVINVGGRKIKVNVDIDMMETEAYFLASEVFRYVELNGVELEEQADGQFLVPWRDSTGAKPAQVGYWMFRGNWAVTMRNAVCRVYNLAKPASLPW